MVMGTARRLVWWNTYTWRLYCYRIRMYWTLSKEGMESSTEIEKAS